MGPGVGKKTKDSQSGRNRINFIFIVQYYCKMSNLGILLGEILEADVRVRNFSIRFLYFWGCSLTRSAAGTNYPC